METTNNKYYNYILLDPRKPQKWSYKDYTFDFLPFYVGKGSGNRVRAHYWDSESTNPYKRNIIQQLKYGGYLPNYCIINENSSEDYTFAEEIEIIQYIRDNLTDATLTNISTGGEQPPVYIGKDNVNATYVCQYNTNTGEFIKEWDTASEACRSLGFSSDNCKHITECCRGERRTALGFIWKFEKLKLVTPELGKKFARITFNKLIAYNDTEFHEFKTMKEAYQFLNEPNKGKINSVLKGERKSYKGYYWKTE